MAEAHAAHDPDSSVHDLPSCANAGAGINEEPEATSSEQHNSNKQRCKTQPSSIRTTRCSVDQLSNFDHFLETSTGSRQACTFHAPLQLPAEGFDKLIHLLQTSGRVRGVSLAYNSISDEGVKVGWGDASKQLC